MKKCETCLGDGLIGAGPQPWLKQGLVRQCPDCNGTGKISPTDAQVAPTEPVPEASQDAPVDNSATDQEAPTGFLGSLKKAILG